MTRLLLSVVCCLTCSIVNADDWPQWMGPHRDSVWRETGIVEKFPAEGLKVKWRVPISGGYAGPAVAHGKVYVSDYVVESGTPVNGPGARPDLAGKERVLCFQTADGKLLWKHEYARPYKISYPAGPRATPTIAGGKVYALGAEGDLICLDAQSGAVAWSKNFQKDYGVATPVWGHCAHPLVDRNKLFCVVGGEGSVAVAFDKDTGKELWRALSASEPGYCPPTMIEAGGKRQLLIWHPEALNSLDPETGKVYWSQPLKPDFAMSVTAPRKHGDFLYASSIRNVAALFKLDKDKPGAEVVWKGDIKSAVNCSNSTPLIDGDMIYGTCCNSGALRGVDLATGARVWETLKATQGGERGMSHGTAFIVKQGDRFILFNEKGDLILARLSRAGYEEISRFHVLEPTGECFGRSVVWSHPAFAEKCAFVRNDKELVCVSLAAEK